MTNMLCNECDKRGLCKCLCPEAEAYVNQDWVGQKELVVGGTPEDYAEWPEGEAKTSFTPMEKKILTRLTEGKTREQIAQELDITRNSLRMHIKRLKRKRVEIS